MGQTAPFYYLWKDRDEQDLRLLLRTSFAFFWLSVMLLQTLGDDDHWISLFSPSPASFLIALQLACHEHALSLLSRIDL